MRVPALRFTLGPARWLRPGGVGVLLAGALGACTLITDIDREDIPEPVPPTFPEVDAGPQPAPDAASPPPLPPAPPLDAGGDAGSDGGDASAG